VKLSVTVPAALAARLSGAGGHGLVLPAALCAAALCAGLLAAWVAGDAVANATHRLDQARAQQRRTTAELDAARVLDERLVPALARYRTLVERGVVGRQAEDEWPARVANALAAPNATAHGFRDGIRTRFAPARPLAPSAGGEASTAASGRAAAGLRLMGRSLQVEATLRHEGELLALLGRLEADRSRIVLTQGCRLERLAPVDARAPTVRANCLLEGLTIADAAEAQR